MFCSSGSRDAAECFTGSVFRYVGRVVARAAGVDVVGYEGMH